jgi:hypothetical protein
MRIPLAAGAAVNLMFATLLARFDSATATLPISTLPLWAALLAAAVIGSGLFGFAAGIAFSPSTCASMFWLFHGQRDSNPFSNTTPMPFPFRNALFWTGESWHHPSNHFGQ